MKNIAKNYQIKKTELTIKNENELKDAEDKTIYCLNFDLFSLKK